MATEDNDKIKSLNLALEEQRRDYDVLHSLHEAIKIKNLTFLATAFGLLGYLYAANNGSKNLKKKLFIPDQAYGDIIYVAGILLLLGAIAGFIVVLTKNRVWKTAFQNDQEDKLMDNYQEYLTYMHKRYKHISKVNGECYEKRRYLLNISFMAMILGGSILVTIKTFGG